MRLLSLLLSTLQASIAVAISVTSTSSTNITVDPQGSVRLNGLSFQQDPLTTYGDYQYITFYSTAPAGYGHQYVNVGRRKINPSVGAWEFLTLSDYDQTTLDEHNTISMGISGDGKIHLSFDHHDVPLNYRVSNTGIAQTPPSSWTASLFGSVQHSLPGSTGPWTPLTYPRFERLPGGDLLFEFRIGQSGSGDSYIHRYSTSTGKWTAVGKYIQGANNNAYINGLTYGNGNLYASWCWRETPDPVTNHDVFFVYSSDEGKTWKTSDGKTASKPITPSTAGAKVFTVAQGNGLLNQEAQWADSTGRFHALMRDRTSGQQRYVHYFRSATGTWTRNVLNLANIPPPPAVGLRGKIVTDKSGNNAIIAVQNEDKLETHIFGATAAKSFADWTEIAVIKNVQGEPLIDEERLQRSNVLSLFIRQGGPFGDRKVQVWDFGLSL